MFSSDSIPRKLGILWVLYFVQGLPFGFQATALPIYLRDAGLSLTMIGFATALSLPWMLKAFWAPLVDRYASDRFGRRRSWILPMQGGLLVACLVAGLIHPGSDLAILFALVFLMNLFAATMDIAVDGLAIDLLEVSELGRGNIAQVVGYKVGMLTGGGLLVWASGTIGWQGLFFCMALLVGVAIVFTLGYRERHLPNPVEPTSPMVHPTMRDVLRLLRHRLTSSGMVWLLLFIGTYKLGENMADTMFKPFLYDAGFGREQIGLWVGTWGMLFSILGSFTGGMVASRLPLLRTVGIAAAFRVLPVAGEWWLSVVVPTEGRVLAVTCAEHFFGGALTTALFAYMMSRVDKRIGATHYTLLAAVEVWGKVPSGWVSGLITEQTSYPFIFALATVLSVLFLALLVPLSRSESREAAERSVAAAN
ncbi:MAG: MFS transporter [Acidobacteriota bacterium]|nr:MFS transporter [Acidobacteriota bacterium]